MSPHGQRATPLFQQRSLRDKRPEEVVDRKAAHVVDPQTFAATVKHNGLGLRIVVAEGAQWPQVSTGYGAGVLDLERLNARLSVDDEVGVPSI